MLTSRRFAPLLLAAWFFGASGCTTWQGRPGVLTLTLEPRDQVKLWVRGESHQVHGVRVYRDSVQAVPFIRPPDCDSCATRYAVSEVDSVQVRSFELRRSIVAAILLAPVVYGVYIFSHLPRD